MGKREVIVEPGVPNTPTDHLCKVCGLYRTPAFPIIEVTDDYGTHRFTYDETGRTIDLL